MKQIIIVMVFMISYTASAQKSLSEYKYVVVPKTFNDLKKENQYRVNTLVKHLYTKKGFTTVFQDNLPEDLYENKCLALYADMIDESSMFTTKTVLILKDCDGKQILISQQGRSKKKDYEESYKEAITKAFNSFVGLDYSYQPQVKEENEAPVTLNFDNDVKTVDNKPKESRLIEQTATRDVQSFKDNTPIESSYKKGEPIINEQSVEKAKDEIAKSVNTNVDEIVSQKEITKLSGVLYAQELTNGYQLVDSTPQIQLKMYKSAMPNVYVAKSNDKDGVVYTSDGKWYFEFYSGSSMVREELNIKF